MASALTSFQSAALASILFFCTAVLFLLNEPLITSSEKMTVLGGAASSLLFFFSMIVRFSSSVCLSSGDGLCYPLFVLVLVFV